MWKTVGKIYMVIIFQIINYDIAPYKYKTTLLIALRSTYLGKYLYNITKLYLTHARKSDTVCQQYILL